MIKELFNSFSTTNKNDWRAVAQQELKGQDPFEKLSFELDNITQQPFYDHSDEQNTAVARLPVSTDAFLGPRTWHNLPEVNCTNASDANTLALEHLNQGADGILFKITHQVDLSKLLQNIELPYCSVVFWGDIGQQDLLVDFEQYLRKASINPSQLSGGFFWNEFSQSQCNMALELFKGFPKFHSLGLILPRMGDSTEEISAGLINTYRLATSYQSRDIAALLNQVALSFPVGPLFFTEMAKLKAAKQLWDQVAGAFGVLDEVKPLYTHGRSDAFSREEYDPNGNMIKSTTAAASAILGGCDAITVLSDDAESSFKNRVARNVLTILREESKLNITADPTAGSYYVDHLVDQLAKESWHKFQLQLK